MISIWYSYIRWGKSIGQDKRDNLSKYVIQYLENKSIEENEKKELVDIILSEYGKSKKRALTDTNNLNPIMILFNENEEIIEQISKYTNKRKLSEINISFKIKMPKKYEFEE